MAEPLQHGNTGQVTARTRRNIDKLALNRYRRFFLLNYIILVVLAPLQAQTGPCGGPAGNTYYVATTGSDTNPCSSNNPCREIRRALTLVQAGDTIHVADGNYLGFTAADLNGTATAPITLQAMGTNVWVQRTTDRPGLENRDNIFITFCSYLIIDGLNSSNAPRAGVRIDASVSVTVRNGRYGNNTTWGIFTDFSDDLRIENNECYASINEHGIYHSNSGDRPIIRNNRCYDNRANGIHMNGDLSAGGDGLITGALVENNIIWNNGTGGGAGINMDGVQDSIIRNNVLYNNHASGITLYDGDGAQGPRGNLVAHNTIDQAADARWALLIWNAAGTNTVRNNILHNRNPTHGGLNFLTATDAATTDSDYNAFGGTCTITTNDNVTRFTLAQWQALGRELHSICAPITDLVADARADYHLKTNSPAINAGQTLPTVRLDLDWRTRPAGPASDIGAYEFGAVVTPPPVFVERSTSNICLSFPTMIGQTYRVERTDDLTAGFPSIVTNNIAGTGDRIFVPDPGAALLPKRFYRVSVGP